MYGKGRFVNASVGLLATAGLLAFAASGQAAQPSSPALATTTAGCHGEPWKLPPKMGGLPVDGGARTLRDVQVELDRKYRRKDHRRYMLFGPDGRSASPLPQLLDTSEMLDLYVVAWESRRDDYRVSARSCDRKDAASANHGPKLRGPAVPVLELTPSTRGGRLEVLSWTVGPFDGEAAELGLEAPRAQRDVMRVRSTWTIEVHPVAHYALRPGVFGSDLEQNHYEFRNGILRHDYASPFHGGLAAVWYLDAAGVSADGFPRELKHRFNPMVAIPFDRVGKLWYAGLNWMVAPGFDLDLGLQFESIDRLSDFAPIVQDAGGTFSVNTLARWDTAPFVGFSIDAETILKPLHRFLRGE